MIYTTPPLNGATGATSCKVTIGSTQPQNDWANVTVSPPFTPYWSIVPPAPRKSSACPHCTPKCPHGYPADDAPSVSTYPTVTWTTSGNQS